MPEMAKWLCIEVTKLNSQITIAVGKQIASGLKHG